MPEAAEEKVLAIEDRIFDQANLLTSPEEDSIFTLIKNLESEIGTQIGVMTMDTLAGHKIEEFSLKTADSLDDQLIMTAFC